MRRTVACRLLFGRRPADPERQAKARPWWDHVLFTLGMVGGALAFAGCIWGTRRLYYMYRADGDDVYVMNTVREHMRRNPTLAVAMVKITVHHVFSNTKTPFGAPLVVPEELKEEASEILRVLRQVQRDQPQVSLADLWVLASCYALSGLGGPIADSRWGNRPCASEDVPIVVTKPQIKESGRDVMLLKRLLVDQDFPCHEMVALVGHRTLGCHLGSKTDRCTRNPVVFDNDYFINLKEHKWLSNKKGDLFMCNDDDAADLKMQPIDLSLLDDSLTSGWVTKFAENEIKFFNTFAAALQKIHLRGYFVNDM